MKTTYIVVTMVIGLLASTTARAELRHVEMKTLGMD
jgi:hypothetical protein